MEAFAKKSGDALQQKKRRGVLAMLRSPCFESAQLLTRSTSQLSFQNRKAAEAFMPPAASLKYLISDRCPLISGVNYPIFRESSVG